MLLCIIIVLIIPYFVFADDTAPLKKLTEVQKESGYAAVTPGSDNNLIENAGKIVNVFFSLLGVIFLILMLIAGYNWMTAAGEQAKVEKAQSTIRRAIIGLIIVIGSYAISNFVIYKLLN